MMLASASSIQAATRFARCPAYQQTLVAPSWTSPTCSTVSVVTGLRASRAVPSFRVPPTHKNRRDGGTDNVQRFATRRQARTVIGHAPLDSIYSVTLLHALGAVYSGAREARGGANRIVKRSYLHTSLRRHPPFVQQSGRYFVATALGRHARLS